MKKVVAVLLCMAMLVSISGCSGVLTTAVNALVSVFKDDDAEKEAKMISGEITSGQFVLDGVVYEFPMDLKYWLDNGWHTPENYENKDEFRMKSGLTSMKFELSNKSGDYVWVSVMNNSLTDAKVEDCMVSSVYIPMDKFNVTLPQGISKKSKLSEAVEVYGESEGDEAVRAKYSYKSDNTWECCVELDVSEGGSQESAITGVSYYLVTFSNLMEKMIDEKGAEETCEFFVNTMMNASYKMDFEDYLNYRFSEYREADVVYQNEVDYFASYLMYYADADKKYVTSSQDKRFKEIAKKILKNAKWEVKDVSLKQDRTGTLTIDIYPTNFRELTYEEARDAVDNYYAKYKGVDFNALSNEEYTKIEQGYIDTVLAVFEKHASSVGTLSPVTKTYDVDLQNGVLTEEQWYEIDDCIMNIMSEE